MKWASKKANWQLCTGTYIVSASGSIHSTKQLVTSRLSFYLHMYMFVKWAGARFWSPKSCSIYPLLMISVAPIPPVNIKDRETSFIGKLYSQLAWHLVRLGNNRFMYCGNVDGISVFLVSLAIGSTPRTKQRVHSHVWMSMPSHHNHGISSCLPFCCANYTIMISFLHVHMN